MPKLKLQTALGILFLTAVAITILAGVKKGVFVDHTKILPVLLGVPKEGFTSRGTFELSYKGNNYVVKPLQDYELDGLVVSHNDIDSFMDIVHDSNSLDTKDVAVIWGSNLESNDFHEVEFSNTDTWVHWQYPRGVSFSPRCVANNHLITDSDAVREQIAKVRVGDQIHIKGLLVNYRPQDSPHWRESSLSRSDTGNGACEVVFVTDLEILVAATPGWYKLYDYGWKGIVFIPLVMLVISMLRIFAEARKLRHKHEHPYPPIPE